MMNFTGVAALPTAFVLLTAILMFGGRKRRSLDEASHKAAGIIVTLLLICSIMWITVAFIRSLIFLTTLYRYFGMGVRE